jgi:ubiquinone/menaquinone biosynthesis C-methylase UbiE
MREAMESDFKNSWDRWADKHRDPFLSVHRSSDKAQLDLIVKDIIEKLSPRKGEKLLDAGCGSGILLSELVRVTEIMGIGIDFSGKEIEIAKTHFPYISFRVGSVESIAFPDRSFDRVLCYGVLLYVENWKPALHELLRVSKDDGMILLGDLPSIRHRPKLYWDYLKKVPKLIFQLDLLKNIFSYREATPWYWMDLKSMVHYIESLGHQAKILHQPKGHHQYGGATGNYRFDILVRKGIQ